MATTPTVAYAPQTPEINDTKIPAPPPVPRFVEFEARAGSEVRCPRCDWLLAVIAPDGNLVTSKGNHGAIAADRGGATVNCRRCGGWVRHVFPPLEPRAAELDALRLRADERIAQLRASISALREAVQEMRERGK